MPKVFEYQGEVILGCQEGGMASPSISLEGLPDGPMRPDINSVVRELFKDPDRYNNPWTLDAVLREFFGSERINDMGDELVGNLKITIEEME